MADIIPFDFETNAVRVVMQESEPWFVAADVCRVLGINKYRDAVARLDDDEGCPVLVDTLGGKQSMTAVAESGLYALIFMSRKPAAKRFRKWVTSEVLPSIRRDGFYALPADERDALSEKRAYFSSLPEEHQEKARRRAEALRLMEEAIESGATVTQAVEAAAQDMGCSPRTIWGYRRAVYMVPKQDWEAACAPRWAGPRGMLAECHPEALRLYLDAVQSGRRMAECYRQMAAVAQERGWEPIPSARTLRRFAGRVLPARQRKIH